MTRILGSLIVFAALGLTLAAQDPDPKDPPKKDAPGFFDDILKGLFGEKKDPPNPAAKEPAKKDDKPAAKEGKEPKDPKEGEPKDGDPKEGEPKQPPAENPDEVIKRLKENFNKTEERLEGKDPGEETRKLQEQIIADIEKLLQQQNDGGGGGGGGGDGGGGGGGGANGGGGGGAKNQGGGGGGKDDQKKDNNGGGGGKDNEAKNGDKDKKNGGGGAGKDKKDPDENAKNEPPQKDGGGKDGKDGKGGGGNGGDSPKRPTVADLHQNPWGHLPEKKRQEMDAYGRESFPRKYEQLLREYYRTIAEQGTIGAKRP